jgi:hypothetical protein
MDMEKDIRRGQRAEAILADDLMTEAKAHIEAELWRLFRTTAPGDLETLKFIKAMQFFHEKYNAYLTSVVSGGRLAIANEKARKTLKERFFG